MSGPEWFLIGVVVLLACAAAGWRFGANRPRVDHPPPAAWWACGSCHSVNQIGAGGVDNCYACHRPPDPSSTGHLRTAPVFTVSQQIGSSRKGGWDRDVSAMLAHEPDTTPEPPEPEEPTPTVGEPPSADPGADLAPPAGR